MEIWESEHITKIVNEAQKFPAIWEQGMYYNGGKYRILFERIPADGNLCIDTDNGNIYRLTAEDIQVGVMEFAECNLVGYLKSGIIYKK